MKINSLLQEGITAASSPENATNSAPQMGRSDKFLEDEQVTETSSCDVGSVASPIGQMQRRAKGSIFSGIKTSAKYPNSKAVKEGNEFGTFSALKDWQVWNVLVYNNFYRGKYADYGPRPYSVVASSPEEARQVVINNADYVLQDLLSRKLQNGKKVLPRGSALPVEEKRVGKAEPGSITTIGFKEMLTPEGPMNLKFSNGKIVASQDEQEVSENEAGTKGFRVTWTEAGQKCTSGLLLKPHAIEHAKMLQKKPGATDVKVVPYNPREVEEGLGADTAKLLGIPVVAGALAVGANHLDQQQPHVEIGGQSAKIIHADSTMMPRDTMLLKGSDGKMYHVWMTSGKGSGHALLASPAEVKEGVAEASWDKEGSWSKQMKRQQRQAEKRMATDRKTGKQYDPDQEFEKLKNSPEFQAQMKRMAAKEGAAKGSDYNEPFDYEEWKASTVKPRKPRGHKEAELMIQQQKEINRKRKEQEQGQLDEVNPHNYDSDVDYYAALKAPVKQRSSVPPTRGVDPDDEAYFREIWRKNKLAQQQKEREADHERLATGTNEGMMDTIKSIPKKADAWLNSPIKGMQGKHAQHAVNGAVSAGVHGHAVGHAMADAGVAEEQELDEKSKSKAQFRMMAAVANNPKFAKKVGIKQSVGKEFHKADKGANYKSLPSKVKEGEVERTATGLKHTGDYPDHPKANGREFQSDPDRLNKSETGRLDKAFGVKWEPKGKRKEISGDPTGVNEAEIAEDKLASELYRDLQIFKKAADKDIGQKAKNKDLSSKAKDTDIVTKEDCWDDYTQIGMKKKNGKTVPNCVPKK